MLIGIRFRCRFSDLFAFRSTAYYDFETSSVVSVYVEVDPSVCRMSAKRDVTVKSVRANDVNKRKL